MNNSGNIDLADAFKKLLAQNQSLEGRLQEYTRIIESRDAEINVLQSMLSDSNAYRSSTDNQLDELSNLKQYISNLQQQVAGSVYMSGGRQQQAYQNSMEEQLRNLNKEYTYLQTQLTDLQNELQEANSRNLLLQQQVSRVAELESLLENAELELSKWRQQAEQQREMIIKGLNLPG